jgi:hypothetical protein
VQGAGSGQRLVEPCVSGREVVLRDELRLDLVATADELYERDLLACKPPARRFEPDELGPEPRIDRVGEKTSRVVGDRRVRGLAFGVDPRPELGRSRVTVDQPGLEPAEAEGELQVALAEVRSRGDGRGTRAGRSG